MDFGPYYSREATPQEKKRLIPLIILLGLALAGLFSGRSLGFF